MSQSLTLDSQEVMETNQVFIRLVNFFVAKIESLPAYKEEMEASLKYLTEDLGKDLALFEVVTFHYYLKSVNPEETLKQLKRISMMLANFNQFA